MYTSHCLGSSHGSSTHHDPPNDYSFATKGHIHTKDHSTSVGHSQSSNMGLDDIDFSLSTIGWMDLLTHDNSTSMPSHMASPISSSLLGHLLVTIHANIDAEMELDEV